MAQKTIPYKIPQIVEAKDPSGSFWQLRVRMHSELAEKFPDEAWGTSITAIGLPSHQTDQYTGYVLVDIEPIKGQNELFWIFEKLDGPEWTTIVQGVPDLVPSKFKRFVKTTQTRQDVDPDTQPNALTGTKMQSLVAQEDDTGRAALRDTTQQITENTALQGQQTGTWGINTTVEQLEDEGDAVDSGVGVKSSSHTPLGNGMSIRKTVNYPASTDTIATLSGQEHDSTYGIVVNVDRSLVSAAASKTLAGAERASGKFVELKPIDKWHSIMIASKIDGVPSSYSWTEFANFSAPNVLKSYGVIVDSNVSASGKTGGGDNIGDIISRDLGWRCEASATLTMFAQGVAFSVIESGRRGNAKVRVTRSFHLGPPNSSGDTIHKFAPGSGYIWIKGKTLARSAMSYKSGVGFVNTASGGSSTHKEDSKLSLHRFGPAEFADGLAFEKRGDPASVKGDIATAAGSTPSRGLYPAVVLNDKIGLEYEVEKSSSSAVLQQGTNITWAIKVYPWRLGMWIKDTYILTVP